MDRRLKPGQALLHAMATDRFVEKVIELRHIEAVKLPGPKSRAKGGGVLLRTQLWTGVVRETPEELQALGWKGVVTE